MQDIEKVLEEYKDMVLKKAYAASEQGLEVEDLIQEGMIALASAYSNFREDGGASFATYASTCIDNRLKNVKIAANAKKNLVLREALSLDEPNPDGSTLGEMLTADVPGPEKEAIYNEMLSRLTDKNNKLFSKLEHEVLEHLLNGRDQKQIAMLLGKSGKQINNACSRIRGKILNSL